MKPNLRTSCLIALFILFAFLKGHSQYPFEEMANPNANFYDLVDSMDQYEIDRTGLPFDTAAVKEFRRWQSFWQSRVYDTPQKRGDISFANHELVKYLQSGNTCEQSPPTFTGDWRQLGPFSYSVQFMGRIESILYNPAFPNRLYVGSQTGGLFRTNNIQDAMPDWENLTDGTVWNGNHKYGKRSFGQGYLPSYRG